MGSDQAASGTGALMPLFPLGAVLFPGGPLALRIFETRYIEMVRLCMRKSSSFGVVALPGGSEVGVHAAGSMSVIGTTARIVDFDTMSDGLLGILCRGEHKFTVLERWQQTDGLHVARIECATAEPHVAVPGEFSRLVQLVRRTLPELGGLYAGVPEDFADASWVGWRLAEILPLSLAEKQECLQLDDPLERLARLAARLA